MTGAASKQNKSNGTSIPGQAEPANPRVTVLPTRYVPSPINKDFATRTTNAFGAPLDEALATEWPTDAHLAAYEPVTRDGVTVRLKTEMLAEGIPVHMVALIGDVDDEIAHKAKTPARDEWRDDVLPRIGASGLAYYVTRGGYRVLGLIDEWLHTPEDAREWSPFYLGWREYLLQTHGLTIDDKCADWTRLYRLPNVRRKGVGPVTAPVHGVPRAVDWEAQWIAPPEKKARAKGGAPAKGRARAKALTPRPTSNDRALTGAERSDLDQAAKLIAPHFERPHRNALALAIGGWLCNAGMPPSAAEHLIGQLPSDNPAARVRDALRAWGVATPAGWSRLAELLPAETMAELHALRVMSSSTREWMDRSTAKREARRTATAEPEAASAASAEPEAASAASAEPEAASAGSTGCDPDVDLVIEHLATAAAGVFQRSGALVIVTRDACTDGEVVRPAGTPTIRELVPARLKEIIRMTAGHRAAQLASEVIARREWSHIRPLDAIVSFPVMRRDGTLLLTSGYDAPTHTLAGMTISVDVSDAPTQEDARAALAVLTELVGDFPFASDAQRASWVAMLLTVVARPAIDGPTPLGLFEASQRGSGKTMLVDVINMIVIGAAAPRRVAPKNREEWDKVMLSILLAGDPLVLFDNVTTMLVSDALDTVLTGTMYAQRLLGVNEDRRVAIRTVFCVTANNARLSADLVRRSLGCRLEPGVENPQTRTGFRIPDLIGHVRSRRAHYLAAALTLLRAYVVAGRPPVAARPMGSYTAWCHVVRDPLVWAGAADPAETQDVLRESADVERDEVSVLLQEWHALLGERAVTARALLDAAHRGRAPGVDPVGANMAQKVEATVADAHASDEDGLLDALRGVMPRQPSGGAAEPTSHAIGNKLRTLRGTIVGGLVLREGPRVRGDRHTYFVARVVTP